MASDNREPQTRGMSMSTNQIDRTDIAAEQLAYRYAVAEQGYVGTWAEWQALSDADRLGYEQGAAGIPTA
jgi:hypothetical protein